MDSINVAYIVAGVVVTLIITYIGGYANGRHSAHSEEGE